MVKVNDLTFYNRKSKQMKKYFLLAVAAFIFAAKTFAQWNVQNSAFATPEMEVWCISTPAANVAWASAYDTTFASFQGDYTLTTNGGTTWSSAVITNSNGFYISCLTATDQNNCWAVLNDANNGGAKIMNTSNGGSSWAAQTNNSKFQQPDGYADIIHFWNANDGVAIGDSNNGYWEFYTTTNGGGTWTRVPQGNIPANLNGEYGEDNTFAVVGNTIWFGTGNGRVYKSIDKGLNWTVSQTPLGYVSQIAFRDANNGLVSDGGTTLLYRTTDGGTTWSPVAFNGTIFDYGFCFAPGNPGVYYFSGYGGTSYSLDDGLNWTTVDAIDHTTVSFFSTNVGWSGGWNTNQTTGGMFKWTGSLGLADPENNSGFIVYPNPMSHAAILYSEREMKNVLMVITSVEGREVSRTENNSGHYISIARGDLSAGIYFYTLSDELGVITKGRLIVE